MNGSGKLAAGEAVGGWEHGSRQDNTMNDYAGHKLKPQSSATRFPEQWQNVMSHHAAYLGPTNRELWDTEEERQPCPSFLSSGSCQIKLWSRWRLCGARSTATHSPQPGPSCIAPRRDGASDPRQPPQLQPGSPSSDELQPEWPPSPLTLTQTIHQVCSVQGVTGVLSQRGQEKTEKPPSWTDLHVCMAPWPSLMSSALWWRSRLLSTNTSLTDRMVQKCWQNMKVKSASSLKATRDAEWAGVTKGPYSSQHAARLASQMLLLLTGSSFSPL